MESRNAIAERFLTSAREVIALKDGRRAELLGEVLHLADSIALLDEEIGDAAAAVGQTRLSLISALESQAAEIRRAGVDDDARLPSNLVERLENLEAEVGKLR